MTNLSLDRDEAIVLECEYVYWLNRDSDGDGEYEEIDTFVLTNKRLYCSYEKDNGLFKQNTTELRVWSLSDIKIINGQAQVHQIKYEGDLCLRIQFVQGTEYFVFNNPKKTTPQWVSAINNLLGTAEIPATPEDPKRKGLFTNPFANVASNFRSSAGTTTQNDAPIITPPVRKSQPITADYTDDSQPSPQPQQLETAQPSKEKFCMNCGNKLPSGAIFCSLCGFKVTSTKDSVTVSPDPPVEEKINRTSTPPKVEQKDDVDEDKQTTGTYTQRKQEFVGKVLKCPNCGEVLSSFTAFCPVCKYELRGVKAANSVQEFTLKLSKIKSERELTSFIRNFPIPNAKEDILEFMILASTNIVDETEKSIFDAWIIKFEQCYQKAKLVFIEDSNYVKIQKIYEETSEKIKKRRFVQNIKTVGDSITKSGGFLMQLSHIIIKNAGIIFGIIAYIMAIQIDRTGGNASLYELVGAILLIASVSTLKGRKATYIEFIIGALSGMLSIYLAQFLYNGSLLQLSGGITSIIAAVGFFGKLRSENKEE